MWKEYFDSLDYMDDGTSYFTAGDKGHVFVCLHGAGFSALSFACLAEEIKKFATCVAFDFKGHGFNKAPYKDGDDLSSEVLVKESILVFKHIY